MNTHLEQLGARQSSLHVTAHCAPLHRSAAGAEQPAGPPLVQFNPGGRHNTTSVYPLRGRLSQWAVEWPRALHLPRSTALQGQAQGPKTAE